MDTARILSELRSERERIDRAITALEALNSASTSTRQTTPQSAPKPRGRRISAAGRRRISAAAKKMWAAKKKLAAPAQKTAPARHMSAATKKKLSVSAKKRWAEKQKSAKA